MSKISPKIFNKYRKIAEKYVVNSRTGAADEKRHDRITRRESRAMIRAYRNGLSYHTIASLFKRDPRSVQKKLKDWRQGLLDLEILERGRRVVDFETGRFARLVSFRIGNTFSDMVIIEKIYLQILESKVHDTGLRIEAAIHPYKYDVMLHIENDVEYTVTSQKFKLPRNDFDDFEILCHSLSGTLHQVRLRIDYSEYPNTNILTKYSDAFYLEFPEDDEGLDSTLRDRFQLVDITTDQYQGHLANFINNLSDADNIQLRLFTEKKLSDEYLQVMEDSLLSSGAILLSKVTQEAGIVLMKLQCNKVLSAAITSTEFPDLIGWQLLDHSGSHLRGMYKYNETTIVVKQS